MRVCFLTSPADPGIFFDILDDTGRILLRFDDVLFPNVDAAKSFLCTLLLP